MVTPEFCRLCGDIHTSGCIERYKRALYEAWIASETVDPADRGIALDHDAGTADFAADPTPASIAAFFEAQS